MTQVASGMDTSNDSMLSFQSQHQQTDQQHNTILKLSHEEMELNEAGDSAGVKGMERSVSNLGNNLEFMWPLKKIEN